MEPIWQLLNTKRHNDTWNGAHKGCLRSAIAGRQFPQVRCKQCGWAVHDRCTLCLNDVVEAESPKRSTERKEKTGRDLIDATQEQIDKAPRGDIIHRNWNCQHLEPLRVKHARSEDVRTARDVDVLGHPAWEKGLLLRPAMPLIRKSAVETFHWRVKPL